ncbi:hypothetical protein, variant [Sphaeroforma arctica JP610]|nr:hypothetical protein, variant [Sphaeroforma arctica JP610]KNC87051.1 hypothetical protein, variant [Sphaeroforma arctica JP610]|eukprot:XP_014160954.1 hypothetical protein, variant [Sphaeroforma arctica JP610]
MKVYMAEQDRPSVRWDKATKRMTPTQLDSFDYEFSFRPIDYSAKRAVQPVPTRAETHSTVVTDFVTGVIAACIGRPMIYPGSTWLMRTLLRDALANERASLITKRSGVRCKVVTVDNLALDCMYYDKRTTREAENRVATGASGDINSDHDSDSSEEGLRTARGNTLVITCEGNASFYEASVGMANVDLGYSVLGWNRPGFINSEGLPYPHTDAGAVAGVIEFAIVKLGWRETDIMIYAWSIGGFSASRAVTEYPRVKGLVLDATFDHVLPLALGRMPQWMSSLTRSTIGTWLNLDVAAGVKNYPGPIRFIRRRQDEMISSKLGDLSSNRGNFLITEVLEHRYPHIIRRDYMLALLGHCDAITTPAVDDPAVKEVLVSISSWSSEDSENYSEKWNKLLQETSDKLDLKQVAVINKWLLCVHLDDLNTKHCVPYPSSRWREPKFRF